MLSANETRGFKNLGGPPKPARVCDETNELNARAAARNITPVVFIDLHVLIGAAARCGRRRRWRIERRRRRSGLDGQSARSVIIDRPVVGSS